jgi:hypothetical protein
MRNRGTNKPKPFGPEDDRRGVDVDAWGEVPRMTRWALAGAERAAYEAEQDARRKAAAE